MDLKYKRIDIENTIKSYNLLLDKINKASNFESQLLIIEKINKIRDNYFSMYWISHVNYLLDVNSQYWNDEEKFFIENDPKMENLKLRYYKELNNSKFKKELEQAIGSKVFQIAELEVKLMNDDIITDLSKEKELSNKYTKLLSTSKVIFDNKELSLSELNKYISSSDRKVRIRASKVRSKFMRSIENEIDFIIDELIKIRTHIANKLGFKSYTDVGYIKMRRIGYTKKDISLFRNEIHKYLVPYILKLKEEQRKELKLKKLMYYDNSILFKDGNAIPNGDTKWIINQAENMFKSIDKRIYKLFKLMTDNNYMDLDARQGKRGGGITTYIPNIKTPVFVSNFNGTSFDIEVLTHEFGHSFQLYSSRNLKYYENWWPTFDTCEIHSKSMELLTLPYMEMFFGENAYKYKKEQIHSTLEMLCYICLIDEFQHLIYDKPNLTKSERKTEWLKLEKIYMP